MSTSLTYTSLATVAKLLLYSSLVSQVLATGIPDAGIQNHALELSKSDHPIGRPTVLKKNEKRYHVGGVYQCLEPEWENCIYQIVPNGGCTTFNGSQSFGSIGPDPGTWCAVFQGSQCKGDYLLGKYPGWAQGVNISSFSCWSFSPNKSDIQAAAIPTSVPSGVVLSTTFLPVFGGSNTTSSAAATDMPPSAGASSQTPAATPTGSDSGSTSLAPVPATSGPTSVPGVAIVTFTEMVTVTASDSATATDSAVSSGDGSSSAAATDSASASISASSDSSAPAISAASDASSSGAADATDMPSSSSAGADSAPSASDSSAPASSSSSSASGDY
jgi:hypothetical protein